MHAKLVAVTLNKALENFSLMKSRLPKNKLKLRGMLKAGVISGTSCRQAYSRNVCSKTLMLVVADLSACCFGESHSLIIIIIIIIERILLKRHQ